MYIHVSIYSYIYIHMYIYLCMHAGLVYMYFNQLVRARSHSLSLSHSLYLSLPPSFSLSLLRAGAHTRALYLSLSLFFSLFSLFLALPLPDAIVKITVANHIFLYEYTIWKWLCIIIWTNVYIEKSYIICRTAHNIYIVSICTQNQLKIHESVWLCTAASS